MPYPPLQAFYYFVTRTTMHGRILGAEYKITRQEALRMATWNNAYLTFEEEIKGSIEPGKLADFVVLSDDIMTVPDEQIEHITVLLTSSTETWFSRTSRLRESDACTSRTRVANRFLP